MAGGAGVTTHQVQQPSPVRADTESSVLQRGLLHHQNGKLPEAESDYRTVLASNPGSYFALSLLGALDCQVGRYAKAVELLTRALLSNDSDPALFCNMGIAMMNLGRLGESESAYRRAIALKPDMAEAHSNLGNILMSVNRPEEALSAYRMAISIKPDFVQGYENLGLALQDNGLLEEAAETFRIAIGLQPGHAGTHINMGIVLKDLNLMEQSKASYLQALSIKPDDAAALINLGNVLLELGQFEEAVTVRRRVIKAKPDDAEAYSDLLMSLNFISMSDESLFQEHLTWGTRYGDPLADHIRHHANTPDPYRTLNIGYVSPDYGRHPVGYFMGQFLEHHDRSRFKIFCYSDRVKEDDLTVELRKHADTWIRTAGVTDQALAELVRNDNIDILIDLAGHTRPNRLLTFARKPAPVQMSWLGYWCTTGLVTMDYILMDAVTVPAGGERYFCETLLRLPDTRFCYAPPCYAPDVTLLPAMANEFVTFGSFNNNVKICPEVITLWSEVLHAVEASRLVLKWKSLSDRTVRERLLAAFREFGITSERLDIRGWTSHRDMLNEYGDIDIALDPFPLSGGLTSCEALWMGVPIITLPGERPISRQTCAFLSLVGLDEFIASNPEEYIAIARRFAKEPERLADIRQGLRKRMLRSALCDGPRFARNLEEKYREAWQAWCQNQKSFQFN
jgi:predicted O-linked N-acetylglucosamine transferase (SPINDLY family)